MLNLGQKMIHQLKRVSEFILSVLSLKRAHPTNLSIIQVEKKVWWRSEAQSGENWKKKEQGFLFSRIVGKVLAII